MPAALRDIGDWTPLGAAVQALQNSMQGSFPSAQPLLVMAAYTLLFSFLAVHYFRGAPAGPGRRPAPAAAAPGHHPGTALR
jgi:hypothetical protein